MEKNKRYRMMAPNSKCPRCGIRVHWSCHGTTGYAHCGHSPTAARVFIPGTPLTFCEWEGKCKRRPDGKVEIFYIEEVDY